jgi:hypothetical protein
LASVPAPIVRVTVAVAALAGALASGLVGDSHDPAAKPPVPTPARTAAPTPTPEPPSPFALGLPGVVGKLNAARASARAQLARRAGRHAQARAAKRLRVAFTRAAQRLGHPQTARERDVHAALVATADAYHALAFAARHGQVKRYAGAARRVAKRERRLAALLHARA